MPPSRSDNVVPAQYPTPTLLDGEAGEPKDLRRYELVHRLLSYGRVEERGVVPVPVKDRTVTRYWKVFSIWFSMNVNILA